MVQLVLFCWLEGLGNYNILKLGKYIKKHQWPMLISIPKPPVKAALEEWPPRCLEPLLGWVRLPYCKEHGKGMLKINSGVWVTLSDVNSKNTIVSWDSMRHFHQKIRRGRIHINWRWGNSRRFRSTMVHRRVTLLWLAFSLPGQYKFQHCTNLPILFELNKVL